MYRSMGMGRGRDVSPGELPLTFRRFDVVSFSVALIAKLCEASRLTVQELRYSV